MAGKTVAVLPDNYAAFYAKITLNDSKNKTKLCVFCLSMRQKSHLIQEKRSLFCPFFPSPLCKINRFPLYQIRHTAL
jgi:hypothetical protein